MLSRNGIAKRSRVNYTFLQDSEPQGFENLVVLDSTTDPKVTSVPNFNSNMVQLREPPLVQGCEKKNWRNGSRLCLFLLAASLKVPTLRGEKMQSSLFETQAF
jgi:hypothetical protein